MNKLKFGRMKDNNKLAKLGGITFSLPAGFSCIGALQCLSYAKEVDGKMKISDGKHQKFRCFSATQELIFAGARKMRWHNFNLLKKCKSIGEMVELINVSLPETNWQVARIHVSGDYFSQNYLKSWAIIAERYPWKTFYSYTKSLNFLDDVFIPNNFKLTASVGGKFDHLIPELEVKHAKVFFSEEEAEKAGYQVDHTDELAFKQDKNFGLVIHGQQKKDSLASKALQQLKQKGIFGYNKNKLNKELVSNLVKV